MCNSSLHSMKPASICAATLANRRVRAARTVADLAGEELVAARAVAEAVQRERGPCQVQK